MKRLLITSWATIWKYPKAWIFIILVIILSRVGLLIDRNGSIIYYLFGAVFLLLECIISLGIYRIFSDIIAKRVIIGKDVIKIAFRNLLKLIITYIIVLGSWLMLLLFTYVLTVISYKYLGYSIITLLCGLLVFMVMVLPLFGSMVIPFTLLQFVNEDTRIVKAIQKSIRLLMDNIWGILGITISVLMMNLIGIALQIVVPILFDRSIIDSLNIKSILLKITTTPTGILTYSIFNIIVYPFIKSLIANYYHEITNDEG